MMTFVHIDFYLDIWIKPSWGLDEYSNNSQYFLISSSKRNTRVHKCNTFYTNLATFCFINWKSIPMVNDLGGKCSCSRRNIKFFSLNLFKQISKSNQHLATEIDGLLVVRNQCKLLAGMYKWII